ncbi:MAG: hypothetical protein JWO69_635 [Thermoleophilia bacterium]|jgi:uncharacterized protein YqhQ|nr:hypothetical protein [Thermoleophilia bacterium]
MEASERHPQLAGMALQNGVLMIGPTSWAAAVRLGDGSITTTSQRRPAGGEQLVQQVPLLRGPVRLANMVRVLPRLRRALPDARLGAESREMMTGMVLSSVAPMLVRRRFGRGPVAELVGGLASLATVSAAMRFGPVARYHGAEHKVIRGFELGEPAADVPREHPRCGTQLAVPMLLLGALATRLLLLAAPRSPGAARGAGQLLGMATATELFRATQRGHGGVVADVAARTGLAIQRHATTAEPSAEQLEVATAALDTLLAAEGITA